VRGCKDASAGVSCALLMCASSRDECLAMARSISTTHVSFVLCHGFRVPVAGGRRRLIECINTKFQGVPVSPVHMPPQVPPHMPPPMSASSASTIVELMLQRNEVAQTAVTHRLYEYQGDQFVNGDITFIDGHVQGPQTCRNALIGVLNNVINRVLADHLTARANFGEGDDLYLNDRTNNYLNAYMELSTLLNCIVQVSHETHVALSARAITFIVETVRMQNYTRERGYLTRLLNTVRGLAGPSALPSAAAAPKKSEMKALKTVITCRPKQKKTADAETMVGCGICLDEFKPSLIVKTGCNHDFCTGCISSWAKERGIKSFIRCPCCRAEIDTLTVGTKAEAKKVSAGLAPV